MIIYVCGLEVANNAFTVEQFAKFAQSLPPEYKHVRTIRDTATNIHMGKVCFVTAFYPNEELMNATMHILESLMMRHLFRDENIQFSAHVQMLCEKFTKALAAQRIKAEVRYLG